MSSTRSLVGDGTADSDRDPSHPSQLSSYGQGNNPTLSAIIAQLQAQEGLRAAVASHQAQAAQRQQAQARFSEQLNPLSSLIQSRVHPSLAAAYAGVMNEQFSSQQEMNAAMAASHLNSGLGLTQSAANDLGQATALRQHLASGGGQFGGNAASALSASQSSQQSILDIQQQLQLQQLQQQQLQGMRLSEGYGQLSRGLPSGGGAPDVEIGSDAQRSLLQSKLGSPQDRGQGIISGSAGKGRGSTSSPVRGTVLVPCRARGMPMDHNFKTAHFVVPEDIEHGADLICSYDACRNAGIKFRFCTYCQVPVAKRNFRKRHMHGMDEIGDDDDSKDDGNEEEVSPSGDLSTSSPNQTADRDRAISLAQPSVPSLGRPSSASTQKRNPVSASVPPPAAHVPAPAPTRSVPAPRSIPQPRSVVPTPRPIPAPRPSVAAPHPGPGPGSRPSTQAPGGPMSVPSRESAPFPTAQSATTSSLASAAAVAAVGFKGGGLGGNNAKDNSPSSPCSSLSSAGPNRGGKVGDTPDDTTSSGAKRPSDHRHQPQSRDVPIYGGSKGETIGSLSNLRVQAQSKLTNNGKGSHNATATPKVNEGQGITSDGAANRKEEGAVSRQSSGRKSDDEAVRLKRWHDLLDLRPATDDNEAMSRWLIQVLSVSDRSKPFKDEGGAGKMTSPVAPTLTQHGERPTLAVAPHGRENRSGVQGEAQKAGATPTNGVNADPAKYASHSRQIHQQKPVGLFDSRVSNSSSKHGDGRGAAETAAAEVMAALPQRLGESAAARAAEHRAKLPHSFPSNGSKLYGEDGEASGRKRSKGSFAPDGYPMALVPSPESSKKRRF